jgi:hypothetical protein
MGQVALPLLAIMKVEIGEATMEALRLWSVES